MKALEWVMGFALIAMAIFLLVVVLMQSGKDKRLSGTIGGGTDTYYGQNKGKSRDRIIAILTTIVASVFTVLVVVSYVLIAKFY
jgi:preprotein translocase subunit SecG